MAVVAWVYFRSSVLVYCICLHVCFCKTCLVQCLCSIKLLIAIPRILYFVLRIPLSWVFYTSIRTLDFYLCIGPVNNVIGILVCITLNLQISFGSMHILNIEVYSGPVRSSKYWFTLGTLYLCLLKSFCPFFAMIPELCGEGSDT